MLDIIKDTLIDSIKMLPFLFLSYLLIEYIEHTHGNIGITSNQSMVSAEIELRLNNQMLNLIIDDFASEICI